MAADQLNMESNTNMEAVELVRSPPKKKRKESEEACICILCKSKGRENLYGTDSGRQQVRKASAMLKDGVVVETETPFFYHMTCYRPYILKSKRITKPLNQTPAQENSKDTENVQARKRTQRLSKSELLPSVCIICNQSKRKSETKLFRICEPGRAQEFLDATRFFLDEVFERTSTLNDISSVFASDIMYHNNCMKPYINKFKTSKESENDPVQRKQHDDIKKFVENINFQSKGYTLSDLRGEFMKQNPTLTTSNKEIKSVIIEVYGDNVCFAYPREKSLSQVVYASNVDYGMVVDKVRSCDAIKNCAAILREEAKNYDFKLGEKFCDANDLTRAEIEYEQCRPKQWEKFLQALAPSFIKSATTQRRCDALFQVAYFMIHNGMKKTPRHIANAQAIHNLSRSKTLITMFNRQGLCCSYDDVLRQDQMLANRTIIRAEGHRVPIPPSIKPEILVRGAMDNFDREEDTKSGMHGTHDTVLVLFQDRQVEDNQQDIILDETDRPENYAGMFGIDGTSRSLDKEIGAQKLLCYHKPKRRCTLSSNFLPSSDSSTLTEIRKVGRELDLVWFLSRFLKDSNVPQLEFPDEVEIPSRNAFMSALASHPSYRTFTGFTPILPYPATQYDSIYTSMVNFQDVLHQLNLQEGSLWCDEGVYHIGKEIQLIHPEKFSNIFLGLGGFHLQKVVLACIGLYLRNSGASEIIVETETMGPRSAESALNGNHYARAVRVIGMLCEVMQTLQWRAFLDQCDKAKYSALFSVIKRLQLSVNADRCLSDETKTALNNLSDIQTDFEEFRERGVKESEVFCYWDRFVSTLVPLLRDLIRGDRENNWDLHVCSIRECLPLFFSFDRTNYARWCTLYYDDCLKLEEDHPLIHNDFKNGHFTVQHSSKRFSSVALDQALEQHYNKPAKGSGGIIGITRQKDAVTKHDLISHEKESLTNFLRTICGLDDDDELALHHEFSKSLTIQDQQCVSSMLLFVLERGNPFLRTESCGISNLITGAKMDPQVCEYILHAHEKGETAYQTFVKERLTEKSKSILDPIHKMFPKKQKVKSATESALKETSDTLRWIEIARSRGFSAETLLRYELTSTSYYLTSDGFLKKPEKAQLSKELESKFLEKDEIMVNHPASKENTAVIIDFMAYARKSYVKVLKCKTFGDYFDNLWRKFVRLSEGSLRTDIVFDLYEEKSLKHWERLRRKKVDPIDVTPNSPSTPLPVNMESFWASSQNKKLFQELFIEWLVKQGNHEKPVYLGGGHKVTPKMCMKLTKDSATWIPSLQCECEEADDRIMKHIENCVSTDFVERVMIASADTDVMISALYHFKMCYQKGGLKELWIIKDTRSSVKYIPLHKMIENMDDLLVNILPAVHSLTGCDTTSKIGTKLMALKTARHSGKLLEDFGVAPLDEEMIQNAEQFIAKVLGSSKLNCDGVRFEQYHQAKNLSFSKLCPPSSTMMFHIKRAYLQCYMWMNVLENHSSLDPLKYGYTEEDGNFQPIITTEVVRPPEFVSPCTCRKCARSAVCPCRVAKIHCCPFCKCKGMNLCLNVAK